ncbi:hypothetical protein B0H10DRAFT_2077060, partial [Mycena sp. CBHHK59/15]
MNTVSSTNVEKEVAKALVRKAEVVTIRNPDLAQYVRFVPQSIERTKRLSAAQKLSRSLSL